MATTESAKKSRTKTKEKSKGRTAEEKRAARRVPGARQGRPHAGSGITLEQYKAALIEADGVYSDAANILGCSATAVAKAVKERWPEELQSIVQEFRYRMTDVARKNLQYFMSAQNGDKPTKLRASTFVLTKLDPEYSDRMELAGDVNVKLPEIKVKFVDPPQRKGK